MMPLAMASPGEDVRLIAIHGGQRMRKRLADLGLNLGMTVRVLHDSAQGPLLVAALEKKLLQLPVGEDSHPVLARAAVDNYFLGHCGEWGVGSGE